MNRRTFIETLFASLVILLSLASISVAQQQPTFNSYREARAYARSQNRGMFLLFTASWCGPCQRLKHETLALLMPQLAQRFVVYYVDVDAEHDVAVKFQSKGLIGGSVPTYILSDKQGAVIGTSSGYKSAEEFAQWYKDVVTAYNAKQQKDK